MVFQTLYFLVDLYTERADKRRVQSTPRSACFKEYKPAGGSWREYDLAAGRLRDIDESRLWEQLHFEYRDRDIPISGEISR